MKNKKVYVIIVNFNQPKLTMECINSIRESTYKNFKIIVIDNGSQDESVKLLGKISDIELIVSDKNLGFSGGNNLGIKKAIEEKADYVMLLNNDTVIEKNMISILVDNTNDGIVTVPKIYYHDQHSKRIWYAGGKLIKFKTDTKQFGLNQIDEGQYDKNRIVDFCCGCCFMITINDLKKTGILSEEYFLYCEDNDYSIRLKNNRIIVKYIYSAYMWHKVSASSSGENTSFIAYYVMRNRLYCAIKNKLGKKAVATVIIDGIGKYLKSWVKKNHAYRISLIALMDAVNAKMGKTDRI